MNIHYTAIDFLLLAVAAIATPVLSILAGRTYARIPRSELNLIPRYWLIILRGVGVSLLILLAWHWSIRPYRTLGLDIPVSRAGCVGFVLDVALGVYYFYALLLRRRSAEQLAAARTRLDSYRILPQTRGEIALFPFVGVAGSICEELLYRGFLIWLFAPLTGVWTAGLISAVLFGIGHAYQGWFGIVRTAVIGFLFAGGYILTGSLWWLIVAHIMINVFGGLFARRLRQT